MKATPQPLNKFSGGGEFVTMNARPKIPRMSISTALWKRSLTNATSSVCVNVQFEIGFDYVGRNISPKQDYQFQTWVQVSASSAGLRTDSRLENTRTSGEARPLLLDRLARAWNSKASLLADYTSAYSGQNALAISDKTAQNGTLGPLTAARNRRRGSDRISTPCIEFVFLTLSKVAP